jgi:hypothetical protein
MTSELPLEIIQKDLMEGSISTEYDNTTSWSVIESDLRGSGVQIKAFRPFISNLVDRNLNIGD